MAENLTGAIRIGACSDYFSKLTNYL